MRSLVTDLPNLATKTDAFPYQAQALETIKDMEYCAIFHEQGLGKTKIAADLMLYWLGHRDIDTVLVVTKKQLVQNWVNELKVHTHLAPKVIGQSKKDNFFVYNTPNRVIIANFETLSTDKDRIRMFLKARSVGIIIDESTKLKNPDSRLTHDFFELSPLFKLRTIMTGTPVANRPYDIWAQVYFLDHGKSLGSDFAQFKQTTDLKNNFAEDVAGRVAFETAVSGIFEKIRSFSIRETKKTAGIVLPTKQYMSLVTGFEARQKRMYDAVIKEMRVEISKNGRLFIDDDQEALKRLLRLNQVASNPRLLDDRYDRESGKETVLRGLLEKIIARGEKCIVWSCYIENVDYFAKAFGSYGPRKIHGSMAIAARNKSVEAFKNDETCRVLFATPQAAKEGLTLTVANNVVFYDRGFNLDDYLQAQDRIHRISQKKTCHVYNLLINGSVDQWIDALLAAKQRAAFLAQGDITIDEYDATADYSYGEMIREILSDDQAHALGGANDK